MIKLKKLLVFAVLGLACTLCFTACGDSGKTNDEPDGPIDVNLVLTASASTVPTGQAITFKVTDKGTDVTTTAKIQCVTEDSRTVTSTWAAGKTGSYSFRAVVGDRFSAPIVCEATGSDLKNDFKRKALVFDFTGSQCHPCAAMTNLLNSHARAYPGQMVVVAPHLNIPAPDPLTTPETIALSAAASVNATPTVWVDCRQKLNQTVASTLVSMINNSHNNFPAYCGIAIDSKFEGGKIKISVKVPFIYSGDYKICAVVLEDKVVVEDSVEGTYNHVLRKYATNPMGDGMGWRLAGSEFTHTFEVDAVADWNIDNCSVVVYLFTSYKGSMFVNNVNTCSANGSVKVDE